MTTNAPNSFDNLRPTEPLIVSPSPAPPPRKMPIIPVSVSRRAGFFEVSLIDPTNSTDPTIFGMSSVSTLEQAKSVLRYFKTAKSRGVDSVATNPACHDVLLKALDFTITELEKLNAQ